MLQSRFEWHKKIKAVEREYWCAQLAVERLSVAAKRDATILGEGPTPRDVASTHRNLAGTYLIRMFAEFETAIRSFWRSLRPGRRPQVELLLDRVGHRRRIPAKVLRQAQDVREYRNMLIHDREQELPGVSIEQARHHLSVYFAWLPDQWDS